jgi:hypothetical protein
MRGIKPMQQQQPSIRLDHNSLELLHQGLKELQDQKVQLDVSIHRQEGAIMLLTKLLDEQAEQAEPVHLEGEVELVEES